MSAIRPTLSGHSAETRRASRAQSTYLSVSRAATGLRVDTVLHALR